LPWPGPQENWAEQAGRISNITVGSPPASEALVQPLEVCQDWHGDLDPIAWYGYRCRDLGNIAHDAPARREVSLAAARDVLQHAPQQTIPTRLHPAVTGACQTASGRLLSMTADRSGKSDNLHPALGDAFLTGASAASSA
jgi:hypothetical protein